MNYIALFLVAVVRWFVRGGSRVGGGLVNGLLGDVHLLWCLVSVVSGFLSVRLFLVDVDGLRCVGRNGVHCGLSVDWGSVNHGLVILFVSVGSDSGNDGE